KLQRNKFSSSDNRKCVRGTDSTNPIGETSNAVKALRDDSDELGALADLVSDSIEHLLDLAIGRGRYCVFHFHGLHHEQRLALGNLVPCLDGNRNDFAGHGRGQSARMVALTVFGMSQGIMQAENVRTTLAKYVSFVSMQYDCASAFVSI